MQLLIFALLALAASADNYHSYYNPYNYGHSYGYPSYYGGLGSSYYGGLGYNSLYGHNYGIGAGKLNYALGGHGHYAYAPAKPGTVQVLYDSQPFLSRFESISGPGRISFTLGASGLSGSHNLGTKPRVSSFGKSTVQNVQSSIAGPFEGSQPVSSTKGSGGHVSFVLGSSAVSGISGIHSQGNRPAISSSGRLPSPARSKIASGAGHLGSPGRITFTQDFSRLSGHSADKFVAPPFPKDISNFAVPKPGNILTSQRNLDSNSFALSPPQQISQGNVKAFKDASSVSNPGNSFSFQSNFPTIPSVWDSADVSLGKSPVFVAVPEENLDNDSPNYKHSYATGTEDKSVDSPFPVAGISSDSNRERKPSSLLYSSTGSTIDGISPQHSRSSLYPASRPSEDGSSGQDSKVFSGKPIEDDKTLGVSYSSLDSDDKLPVFVAIPADDLEETSDVKSSNKDNGESVETAPFFDSVEDKSSNEHSSNAGTADHHADERPSFYKHSSFSAVGGSAHHKDDHHKHSSKINNPGNKSPVFVAVPEESLTGDGSFKSGGSHAADQGSVFKFSSVGPSYGTSSGIKSSHGQSSFVLGKSSNYGRVSSPTVKSFSSKAYEEYAYIPDISPMTTFIGNIGPVQGSPVAVVTPFSPLHDYEVVDIEKK